MNVLNLLCKLLAAQLVDLFDDPAAFRRRRQTVRQQMSGDA
ncbi:hypothetical protein [Sphingomonas sp.]|nr:hypothetical protein [Sphingomonas sp.]